MWARLQGVGISVRADTALPWPLLLLHKTSQPALSPGLESVSAATCQIKPKARERERKEPTLSLPSSSCHQPSFSPLFALVPLPHRWCLQEDLSHYMCFQTVQCSLPLLQALFAFLYPFSARVTHHHSNVLLCKTATLCFRVLFSFFFKKVVLKLLGFYKVIMSYSG